MTGFFDPLRAEIARIDPIARYGRIRSVAGGVVAVAGLGPRVRLGDRVQFAGSAGEVVALSDDAAQVLPESGPDGLALGERVQLVGPARISPDDSWLGRIVDPLGRPLDGRPLLGGRLDRPLRAPPPDPATRRRLGPRLSTGLAAFDTFLPIARGQRLGLFAGSGVGKSTLLGDLARGVEADVVVVGLVGERGRELRGFVEDVLGAEGLARSVVVTATSDQSPLLRRRAAWSAMAVAEHFRDRGLHVLLLLDSVTRFAEAHRDVALAAGEPASMRGYPPSTAQMLMALAERAGPGADDAGDITGIFTVLVAGSDMEEPVADILRGTLDGHVVLDRAIAERGRFPAVDLLRSVSRSLPAAASEEENALMTRARQILGAWERSEMMVQAGLYVKGADPMVDAALAVWPALDAFLGARSPGGVVDSFDLLRRALDPPR